MMWREPDKVGQFLLGVAAVLGVFGNRRHGKKDRKVLREINEAVNNKAPHEPTLRSVALETHALARESAQSIGRVEGKLEAHIDTPFMQAHGG